MVRAQLTGAAFQNDSVKEGFHVLSDQMYFVLEAGEETFCLGLKDILACIQVAEEQNELPKLPPGW